MQTNIHIHLFGSPAVFWSENLLSIPRRLVRALLYRLASDPKPVTRGNLQLLFWPDVSESLARRNLSHLLTHLRRALPCPEVLVAIENELRLDSDKYWCDLIEFRKVLREADPDINSLLRIIELYRGSFLEGFYLPGCPEFEQWCLLERNLLERSFLQILETLVDGSIEKGEIIQAVKLAQLYLKTDLLSEAMHQRLIRLYACSGDRHLAIRQFETCSSILETTLGVKPLPETQALYQAVIAGQQQLIMSEPSFSSFELPDPAIPILGRENELRRLEYFFSHFEDQQGQVVFISGEAGIGKSRLMQELARNHKNEASVLHGCGQAGVQTIPYQPVLMILRQILGLGQVGVEIDQAYLPGEKPLPGYIDPIWLSEISRLLPEIQAAYQDIPAPTPLEPESARTRLFDAICYLILTYSIASGPVLLCLDDLQWMDASTKAWVIHIGRFIAHGEYPIMILGAYRSEDADQVLEMRHSLARAGILEEINLSGLDQDALLKILRCLVDRRNGEGELVAQLHHATGGNPFYSLEIIRKLIEDGRLEKQLQESLKFELPASIREAVQSRLDHLSPIAGQVLESGAVLGHNFGIDLLRLTSGRSLNELMLALQELEARILLVEDAGKYGFVHDIVRQHVEENLGYSRKQLLHRRAGRAYEFLVKDAYSILAYHFEAGGELRKALEYHKCASDQAEMLFAWQVVEFHLGRMLEILGQIDPSCSQPELIKERGKLFARRAGICFLQDRLDDRDDDLQALDHLSETSKDDAIRLQSIFNRLRYLIMDGDYYQAIAAAESGLDLLDANPECFLAVNQGHLARARLLSQIGFAYYFLGKPLEALGLLEEAWSLCEGIADSEAHGRIQHILGYVYSLLEDHQRALECQQIAYKNHAQHENFNLMAWDLIDIGAAYNKLGDWNQAERFIQDGLELSMRVGSQRATAYAYTKRGRLDLRRGEYAAALEHFQQVLELRQAVHYGYIITEAEAGMGITLNHLGDYVYSRHWLECARQHCLASGLCRWAAESEIQLGILDMREGRLDMAPKHLEHGLKLARDCSSGECIAAALAAQARLERITGNHNYALDLAGKSAETARGIRLTSCEMWAEIETCMVLEAQGDLGGALEHINSAVYLAENAGQEWISLEEVFMAYACILRAQDRVKEACLQEDHARQVVQAKADSISDQDLRKRYLSKLHSV